MGSMTSSCEDGAGSSRQGKGPAKCIVAEPETLPGWKHDASAPDTKKDSKEATAKSGPGATRNPKKEAGAADPHAAASVAGTPIEAKARSATADKAVAAGSGAAAATGAKAVPASATSAEGPSSKPAPADKKPAAADKSSSGGASGQAAATAPAAEAPGSRQPSKASSPGAAAAPPAPEHRGGTADDSLAGPVETVQENPSLKPSCQPSHEVAKERKALFKSIAEENYAMRNKFGRIPRTVYVTADRCETSVPQAPRGGKKTVVSFSSWSTADALLKFAREPKTKVVGLSFGNGHQVGGGYKTGSVAQEEDLCRRLPTLYTSLFQSKQHDESYPFGPCTCSDVSLPMRYSDVLFTPNLVVARSGEDYRFELLRRGDQVVVALVTACAPDLNRGKELFDPELVYKTIKSIFLAPILCQRDTTTLVLGAWGCGAFGGDPAVISELFVRALATDQLGNYYREVHFAVPGGSGDHNARTFLEALRQAKVDVKEYT